MRVKKNLEGMTFNYLTVLEWVSKGVYKWKCICICGKIYFGNGTQIETGIVKSCGCMAGKATSDRQITHGMSYSEEYEIFKNIQQRCTNPKNPHYKNYGGRGIDICERWTNNFHNFYQDMGKRPSALHSVERRENDLGYSPENCYWATKKEQSRNKRSSVFITFQNRTMILADWASELKVYDSTIRNRMKKGESFESIYKRFEYKKTA